MANEMNINQLKTFLVQQVGSLKIDKAQAEKLGIDGGKFETADRDTNEYLNLNEIITNADLYSEISELYAKENAVEPEPVEPKDAAEPAKEKENKVKANVVDKHGNPAGETVENRKATNEDEGKRVVENRKAR